MPHPLLPHPELGALQLVDLKYVRQTMGDLSIFDYVAEAFLGQITAWRADFDRRTLDFDRKLLAASVHRMKGSCQAIAALGLANEFDQAESALPHMQAPDWPACHARLVSQLALLEAEIRTIISRTP